MPKDIRLDHPGTIHGEEKKKQGRRGQGTIPIEPNQDAHRIIMLRHTFLALWLWVAGVLALNASEWAKQSIYQVLTDRFARTDGSTSASCTRSEYCGGTWRGLINNLDYIKEMGFTAVRLVLWCRVLCGWEC